MDPLRSRKAIAALGVLLAMAAGCSAGVTPPGAAIAYGQVDQTGYTLLRWRQGLDILVWHDLSGSSRCQGSTSTGDPAYRLRCHAESADGRRADWEVQTQDGQTARLSINGQVYDLARGRLFLICTGGQETGVVQLQRDLSAAQVEDQQSIEAFARRDPDVSAFIVPGRRPDRDGPVQATPTPVPTLPPRSTSVESPYDCLATVSATRRLAPHGSGDDCWLTLSDGVTTELTFLADAQVTFRALGINDGHDLLFFYASKGDRLMKVIEATIRPAPYIVRNFDGSLEAVKLYEVARHSPGYPGGSPACLRDANNDYRPLTSLCQ